MGGDKLCVRFSSFFAVLSQYLWPGVSPHSWLAMRELIQRLAAGRAGPLSGENR